MEDSNIYIAKSEIIVPVGQIMLELRNVITGNIIREFYKNMFVSAGRNSLADHLRGTTSDNKGIITYCAVGTGVTAPALADTALQTELARKLISVRNVSSNIASFTTYFGTTEANGTLREAGLFGDNASATSGSGTLFCRSAINRTKSSSDTLTLTWSVTIGQ